MLIPRQLYVFIGIVRRTFRPIEFCLGPVITRSISAVSDAVILAITYKKTSYILKDGSTEGSPNSLLSMLIKNGKHYVLIHIRDKTLIEISGCLSFLSVSILSLRQHYTKFYAFLSILLIFNLTVISLDTLSVFMYVSTTPPVYYPSLA